MPNLIDLTGKKFGMLTVVRFLSKGTRSQTNWLCRCECGSELVVRGGNLNSGNSKSCGCTRKGGLKHGFSDHKLYPVRRTIISRCYDKNNRSYDRYGERGIKVCDEWFDPETFVKWALGSGWKPGLQIDRIDNDGDYCPENCRFITPMENTHNKPPMRSTNTTGYAGVFIPKRAKKNKSENKYQSGVYHKVIGYKYLGMYPTAKEAAIARDQYIIDNNLPHRLQVLTRD